MAETGIILLFILWVAWRIRWIERRLDAILDRMDET